MYIATRRRLAAAVPFALLASVMAAPPAAAQDEATRAQAAALALDDPLPDDPRVTTGELANGVRYYIQENDQPENRAELRLVVNVGSIVEEEDQRGLAHFLEHMAFNGTTNFEKQELVDYMESIGMPLGAGVNASTSFDETVYQIRVPTDSAGALETGLQILEDWAHGVTLASEDIDAERGVVIEEWRLGQGVGARIREVHFPVLLRGSRYAERLPIGTLEVLEGFEHESLRRFYETWYRPGLMAVVVVGDVDGARVEELVIRRFSGIASAPDPEPRPIFGVPDHDETLVAIATDEEAPLSTVSVNFKKPVDEDGTVGAYRRGIVERFFNSMLNQRLSEIGLQPEPPFLSASSSRGRLVRTKEAYLLSAAVQDGGVEEGLRTILTEAERVARHGFTESEFERARTAALRGMERSFEARGTTSSGSYVGRYVSHFLVGAPIAPIELRYALYQRFVPETTLEEVDALAREWITEDNRVVLVAVPEKEGLEPPTEDEILAVLDGIADAEIAPYAETVAEEPLIAELPEPGSIVSERTVDTVGVTEWTLSNGARFALKPTDFRDDQILLTALSPGGTSLLDDDELLRVDMGLINASGVGAFGPIDLRKKLTGEVAGVNATVGGLEEGLSGSASPQDLETMFQLLHLRFTAPRADSTVYLAGLAGARASFENRSASPGAAFSDTLQATLTQNHPRAPLPSLERIEALDLERSLAFYRDRFADASDFTFLLVGDFEVGAVRPLVERYVASLPSLDRVESWRDVDPEPPTGVIEKAVYKGMEPQSQTVIVFTGDFADSRQERAAFQAMNEVLQGMLRDRVREELGGSYGVSVGGSNDWRPAGEYSISIRFGSDPERVDELTEVVFETVRTLQTDGPTAEDLAAVKEQLRRSRETSLESNGYWATQLAHLYRRDGDLADFWGYLDVVNAISAEMIQEAARRYYDLDSYVKVSLFPESMKPGEARDGDLR